MVQVATATSAANECMRERLRGTRTAQRGFLGHQRAIFVGQESGLVHRDVAEELNPVGAAVVDRELHRAQRELVGGHGLVAGDDMTHVVRDEDRRLHQVVARQRDPVPVVELHVRATERAGTGVAQRGAARPACGSGALSSTRDRSFNVTSTMSKVSPRGTAGSRPSPPRVPAPRGRAISRPGPVSPARRRTPPPGRPGPGSGMARTR